MTDFTSEEKDIIASCVNAVLNTIEIGENGEYIANYENFHYFDLFENQVKLLKGLPSKIITW